MRFAPLAFLFLSLMAGEVRSGVLRESPLRTNTVLLTSHADRISQPGDPMKHGSVYDGTPHKTALHPLEAVERNIYCHSSTTSSHRCLTVVEFNDTVLYLTRQSFPHAEFLSYGGGFEESIRPSLARLFRGRGPQVKEIRLYFSDRMNRTESMWSFLFWPAYVGGAALLEVALPGPLDWGRFGLVSVGLWMATTGVIALSMDPAPTLTITRIQFQTDTVRHSEIPAHEQTLMRARETPPDKKSLGSWLFPPRSGPFQQHEQPYGPAER